MTWEKIPKFSRHTINESGEEKIFLKNWILRIIKNPRRRKWNDPLNDR